MSAREDNDPREVWWIYSDHHGMKLAWFLPLNGGMDRPAVSIMGETPDRTGIRDWTHIAEREGWVKVARVEIPSASEVWTAVEWAALERSKT